MSSILGWSVWLLLFLKTSTLLDFSTRQVHRCDVIPIISYTRNQLFSLRGTKNGANQLYDLKAAGLLRYRGSRAGQAGRRSQLRATESRAYESWQPSTDLNRIEVVINRRRPIGECKQTDQPRILREIQFTDTSLHHAGAWNARSLNNKHGFVNELITSSGFDFFGIVEMFHEDQNSPSLIAASPVGYTYTEQACIPSGSEMDLRCYRGVCLFYRQNYIATSKTENRFEKFEHITVLLSVHCCCDLQARVSQAMHKILRWIWWSSGHFKPVHLSSLIIIIIITYI